MTPVGLTFYKILGVEEVLSPSVCAENNFDGHFMSTKSKVGNDSKTINNSPKYVSG